MQFAEFAVRVAEVETKPADLAVVSLLSDLFSDTGDDLPTVTRLAQDRVFPAWDSTTLDIDPRLCHEVTARVAGSNVLADGVEGRLADRGETSAVAASYDFDGQRGLAAFGSDGQDGLTATEVDLELRVLTAASDSGNEETKLKTLYGLFNQANPDEARFPARLVLSKIRIGVGEGTIRDAVAEAFLVAPTDAAAIHDDDADAGTKAAARERRNEAVAAVAHALQVSNDCGMVAGLARDKSEAGLDGIRLGVGRPVQAILARAGTATDALGEWGTATVETKFDGARVQVHRDADGEVSLFPRNMEDVTDALPEVVESVAGAVGDPATLDDGVMAVDNGDEPLSFQEILRRFRRKHGIDRMRGEVRIKLWTFDYLHAAGNDLLVDPLAAHHDRLTVLLGDGSSAVSDPLLPGDPDEIAAYETDTLDADHEGIMLENPDVPYSPSDRGKDWLKREPGVETLDLIVTGAEQGESRRAEFLGTFLLSVRVEAESGDDAFETIGKVTTGTTDEKLAELTDLLEPEIEREVDKEIDIRTSIVFEVGCEEIQTSPTHSSSYTLRFPRFIAVREDKTVETANSLGRVEQLADSQ